MATIAFKKTDAYLLKLSKLGDATEEVAEKALKEGSYIVADQVRANLNKIPTISFGQAIADYRKKEPSKGITAEAKAGLSSSFGITPMRKNGSDWDVHVGFDGYNSVVTKRFPHGQANSMVARSVEKGSSAVARHPFVAPAVSATKKKCIERMQQVIDEEFDKIMN